MRALVTGTMTPVGLFVVRRLHELGCAVTSGGYSRLDYNLHSKAVGRRLVFPSPRYAPREFVQAVLDELARGDYDFYLPTFEEGYLMSYYQELVKRHTRFQTMPYPAIISVHNKQHLEQLAGITGVPIPAPTFCPTTAASLKETAAAVDFPAVVKLPQSCNANGQKIVMDPSGLVPVIEQMVEDYRLREPELPIIQRHIKGPLISTVSLSRNGEILGHVCFKALRVYPRTGGTSSLRQVIRHEAAEAYDRALVAKLNWSGFLSVDYMCEEETGRIYLIDINPRLAPGVIFGHYAGTDLLGAYLDMLMDRPLRTIATPRVGTLAKMHFLEVGCVLNSLLDWQMGFFERLGLWGSVIRALPVPDDVFCWSDNRPFLALWSYILPRLPVLLGKKGGEIFLGKALFDEARFMAERADASCQAALGAID